MPRIYVVKSPKMMHDLAEEMPGLSRAIRRENERLLELKVLKKNRAVNGRKNAKYLREHPEVVDAVKKWVEPILKREELLEWCENFQKRLERRRGYDKRFGSPKKT